MAADSSYCLAFGFSPTPVTRLTSKSSYRSGLQPGHQIGQIQGVLAVAVGRIASGVQPAIDGEVFADGGPELVFLLQAHGYSDSFG